MRLRLVLLSIILLGADTVDAGTTFTHLSKSVEIVDWDKWLKEKDKADEYARKVGAYVYAGSYQIN